MTSGAKFISIGVAAGIASGLLGIGGGLVLVPMLVYVASFEQHHANATSLAAGLFLATAGGVTYAVAGEIDVAAAGLLTAGALVGAPMGARIMHRLSSERLKIAFGVLLVILTFMLVLR